MENTDPTSAQPSSDNPDAIDQGYHEALNRQLGEAESSSWRCAKPCCASAPNSTTSASACSATWSRRASSPTKLLADLLRSSNSLRRGLALEGADFAGLRGGVRLTPARTRARGRGERQSGRHRRGGVRSRASTRPWRWSTHRPGAGRVVSVMQKGYVLNERLLHRHWSQFQNDRPRSRLQAADAVAQISHAIRGPRVHRNQSGRYGNGQDR